MQKYDYQIGVIRAKEDRLLKRLDWDRIVGIISLRDLWAELVRVDVGYKDIVDSDLTENISLYYSKNTLDLYREIADYFLELDLKKSFLYEFDFYNLKLFYKQKFFGINFDENFSNSGFFDIAELKDYLQNSNKYISFDEDFFYQIVQILRDEKNTILPAEFDILLDEYLFGFRIKTAKQLKNEFLENFWKIQVDFYNLKTLISKNFKFFENGNIDIEILKKMTNLSLEEIFVILGKYGYGEIVKNAFLLETNASRWEIEEENFLLNFCQNAVFYSESVEPIISYFYRRLCEIKNINRILCLKSIISRDILPLEQKISKSYFA